MLFPIVPIDPMFILHTQESSVFYSELVKKSGNNENNGHGPVMTGPPAFWLMGSRSEQWDQNP
jgi:hypothetical protein